MFMLFSEHLILGAYFQVGHVDRKLDDISQMLRSMMRIQQQQNQQQRIYFHQNTNHQSQPPVQKYQQNALCGTPQANLRRSPSPNQNDDIFSDNQPEK